MSVDRVTYSGVSTLRKMGEPENRVVALRHHEQPLANAPDELTETTPHLKRIHHIIYKIISAKMLRPEIHKGPQVAICVVHFVKTEHLKYIRKFTIFHNKIGDNEKLFMV